MEVHHHAHPSTGSGTRKKFTHYLWEFLMLFLAVFCGFFAEYMLEHKIEREREKQFIISLISDLKDDSRSITDQMQSLETGILLFDSLSRFVATPELARENGESIYYCARRGVRLTPLVNNNRTIDQLRNSGGFRLIHKQEISNQIMKYYSRYPELRMIEDIFAEENVAFKQAAAKLMDQSIYRVQIIADGSVARIPGPLPLLSYDKDALNQLGFYAVQMNGSRNGMLNMLGRLKESAVQLQHYLEETYDVE